MKKKYYAVKKGRETGIFETWEECSSQVSGFAGAQYRSFSNERDAILWLSGAPVPSNPPASSPKRRASLFSCPEQGTSLSDYTVYTDGSCLRNPKGPGGWACVIRCESTGEISEFSGGSPSTTNNRMEMTAVIEALKRIPESASVSLYTDSQYVKNGLTKWIFSWRRRRWTKADGTPVLNRELWMSLDALCSTHKITFHWVKGHAGNPLNERCDRLAKAEAAKFENHTFM